MKKELGVWLGLMLVAAILATVVFRGAPDVDPVSSGTTNVTIGEFYTLGASADSMQERVIALLEAGLLRERNLVVRRSRAFRAGATPVRGSATFAADSVRIDLSHGNGPNFEEGETAVTGGDLVTVIDSATLWLLRQMKFTIRPLPLAVFLSRRDSTRARWQRDSLDVALAESLVSYHRNESFAHIARARALAASRQYREAIVQLRRAEEQGLDHGDMVSEIARTYQLADSGEAALRVLREWVRDGPDKPRAWGVYAQMLRELGYEQEARQAEAELQTLRR